MERIVGMLMECKELMEKIVDGQNRFLGFRLVAVEHLHNFQFVPNTETHDAVSISAEGNKIF
ncbi:hypothetical protein C1H46_035621 [Malus baccata]|uniref:Uncharacterized protein n=1 Tax=Malus baccata TaxID=106549 RepID=A0A540KX79_MALBA|nr:hypothetical protein C1H46_035621 [Malus baccata]